MAEADAIRRVATALPTVPTADITALLKHMRQEEILVDDGGVLGLGPKGEREFGRRHFLDLVSAFTTPLLMAVRHGSRDLGAVHPTSLIEREGEPCRILLGGRSWQVSGVDWARRIADVAPVTADGRSRWPGSARSVSSVIVGAVEQIVVRGVAHGSLSKRAALQIASLRGDLSFCDEIITPVVGQPGQRTRIWTFAGGRANATLAAAIRQALATVAEADNFGVTVRSRSPKTVAEALGSIDPDSCAVPVPVELGTALKFSICLPPALAEAILEQRLGDRESLAAALSRKPSPL